MVEIVQGRESNFSGMGLEHIIEYEFTVRNVLVMGYRDNGNNHDLFATRILLTNVPYQSIYGCYSHSEFVYRDGPLEIRIECRRQDCAGSTDEKFPYFFLNAQSVPEKHVWLVIDGNGARDKAIEWIKKQCKQYTDKKIRVYNLTEARMAIKLLLLKGIIE